MKKLFPQLSLVGILLASPAFGQTLYWYPNAAPNQGGTGSWDTNTTNWSTTDGGIKTTPLAVPGASNTVTFAGTAGTVTLANNIDVSDFQVNTANYVFSVSAASVSRTISLNNFSGIHLDSATFDTARASGNVLLTLDVKGSNATSFNGTIKDGNVATIGLIKTGTGLLDISGATLSYTGAPATVNGGTLRVSTSGSTGVLNSGQVNLASGTGTSGILELVGNGTSGTFTRVFSTGIRIGNASSGNLAGFSAREGTITVNIDRSSGTLVWDLTTSAANAMRTSTFQLGASSGNGTLRFTTNLQVNADNLNLRSDNGSAAIDGDYAAVLTRGASITNDAVLNRTGDGTLRLSGNSNAFNMRLNISSGTTLIDGLIASDTANTTYGINVSSGAVLGGDGQISLSNAATALKVSGTLLGGRGDGTQSLTINSNLIMESNSILAFGLDDSSNDQLIRTGGSWSFQSNQQVQLFDLGSVGGTYTLITGLGSIVDVSNWSLVNSGAIEGTFSSDAGNIYFSVIPEPSSMALLGVGLLLLVRRKLRRSSKE